MKNMILIMLFISCCTVSFSQPGGGHRSLNWVHGFVGDSDSWKSLDDYFRNRYDISTARISYPSKGGLDQCAQVALPQLVAEGPDPIIVAHSMGGLVTRRMYDMGADIGAYITLGTPHLGSYFADSYLNGDVDAFASDFMDEVFSDILTAAFAPLVNILYQSVMDIFGSDDPQWLGNLVFRFVESFIKSETDDQTIGDLRLNGPYVQGLESPPIPKVNFYSFEDSPVHWKFLAHFIQADNDEDYLVDKFNHLRNIYETIFSISVATSATCLSWPAFILPGCALTGVFAGQLSVELLQAIDCLDQSEASWLALIGALGPAQELCYTEKIFKGWDYNGDGVFDDKDQLIRDSCLWTNVILAGEDSILIKTDVPCGLDEMQDIVKRPDKCHDYEELTEDVSICTMVHTSLKNDGLVVYNTTFEANQTEWMEMSHMNHQELKIHPATRAMMSDLFDNENRFDHNAFSVFLLSKL